MAGTRLWADARFRAHRYVVIDFEGLTPKGQPPVPVEVASIILAVGDDGLIEVDRFNALLRPPADLDLSALYLPPRLTAGELRIADPPGTVMGRLDKRVAGRRFRLVAHHASVEANLIAGYADACPHLSAAPLLDTLRLTRTLDSAQGSYGLDHVMQRLGIPMPPDRHRALADALATAEVFRRFLSAGGETGALRSLHDLERVAGRGPAKQGAPGSNQATLF